MLLVNCGRVPSIQGGIIHSWCELTQHSSNRHAVDQFRSVWEQGWRSGESSCLPPMWSGFKSRHRRHMWVEFVVGSLVCSKRLFSGYSGFPSPQKLTFPNSDSTRNKVDEEPLCGCDACNRYLFIYLFIYLNRTVLMVSSLILLRPLRVYILKQLFFEIEVNSGCNNCSMYMYFQMVKLR